MKKFKYAYRSVSLFLAFLMILFMMPVQHVSAISAGVYTGSVTSSYYNPDTGAVDDGGTSNAALGDGMCRSATGTTALVEYDGKNTWITVRLLLQSNCRNVSFYTRNGYNSYSKVNYEVMQEDSAKDSIDYRFKVSDAGVKIKGSMYVIPMERDVMWYLYINPGSLKSGSGDFVTSIDIGSTPSNVQTGNTAVSSNKGSSSAGNNNSSAGVSAGKDNGSYNASGNSSDSGNAGESSTNNAASDEDTGGVGSADKKNGVSGDGDAGVLNDAGSENADAAGTAGSEEESSADNDNGKDKKDGLSGGESSSAGGAGAAVICAAIAIIAIGAAFFIKKKKK